MPMIIIDSRIIEQTIREKLVKLVDEVIAGTVVSGWLLTLPGDLAHEIIEHGNTTPAEQPVERVLELLDHWEILTNRPKMRGQLVGQIVRACLNIDGPPADAEVAKKLWREWFDANVAADELPTQAKPVGAGECPTDED